MFSDDFDDLPDPASWTTHLQQWNLKVATYDLPHSSSHHISDDLNSVIADEIFRQCDDIDGLKAGITPRKNGRRRLESK